MALLMPVRALSGFRTIYDRYFIYITVVGFNVLLHTLFKVDSVDATSDL